MMLGIFFRQTNMLMQEITKSQEELSIISYYVENIFHWGFYHFL